MRNSRLGSPRLSSRLRSLDTGLLFRGASGVVAVMVALEVATRTDLLPSRFFPPVSAMLVEFGEQLWQPALWQAVGHTLAGWAVGMAVAFGVALPSGLMIGTFTPLFHASRFVIEFLRPIPSVALIPIAVLVFNSSLEMKVFLVAFACTWPMLFQTIYGVRDVDPLALDTARSYGLPASACFRRVVLPSAAPYIATGVRISAAIGLILAVTAELVVGSPGVGRLVVEAQAAGAVTAMYAHVIAIGLLGLMINELVRLVERRLLSWHVSIRGVVR